MIDINSEEIKKQLPTSPGGVCCKFVKLTDTLGLKLYRHECKRDNNYIVQSELAELGLAPEVYEKVDGIHPQLPYGYVTERVQTVEDLRLELVDCDQDTYEKICIEIEYEYQDEINELFIKLSEVGYPFEDFHLGNIGFKDGRIVRIDCGTNDWEYLTNYGCTAALDLVSV